MSLLKNEEFSFFTLPEEIDSESTHGKILIKELFFGKECSEKGHYFNAPSTLCKCGKKQITNEYLSKLKKFRNAVEEDDLTPDSVVHED